MAPAPTAFVGVAVSRIDVGRVSLDRVASPLPMGSVWQGPVAVTSVVVGTGATSSAYIPGMTCAPDPPGTADEFAVVGDDRSGGRP